MEEKIESRELLWFEEVTDEKAEKPDYRCKGDLFKNQAAVFPASPVTMYERSPIMAHLLRDACLSHRSRPTRQRQPLHHAQLTTFGDTFTCWDAQQTRAWSYVPIHTLVDQHYMMNDGTIRR